MHADPFPPSSSRASKPLQLVHSDVHGPVKVSTHQGYRYWVTFIDDFSCFKAVYLLKQKSETFAALKQFKAWAENVTGAKLGTLRDDKGGEYISREFEVFCIEYGIQRQHTVRNCPQQNGFLWHQARSLYTFVFGAVLLMCSSRGTSNHLGALGPIWRSVSSWDTLRATRAESFTTLSLRRWLSQSELTSMTVTSCFRDILFPTSLPLVLTPSLRLP